MRVVFFVHALASCWNNGNAHFLRGIARELLATSHEVAIYEPNGGWSLQNLLREHGAHAADSFKRAFPTLQSKFYDLETLDLDRALDGAALFVQPDDEAALRTDLEELLSDPARAAGLGERARRRSQRYTARRMADSYLDAYRALMSDGADRHRENAVGALA